MTQVQVENQAPIWRPGRFLLPGVIVLGTLAGGALIARGGGLEWLFVGAALGCALFVILGMVGYRSALTWIVLSPILYPFFRMPRVQPLITFDRLWIFAMLSLLLFVPRAVRATRSSRLLAWSLVVLSVAYVARGVFTIQPVANGVPSVVVDGILIPVMLFFGVRRVFTSKERCMRAGAAMSFAGCYIASLGIAERFAHFQLATLSGGAPFFDASIGQVRVSGPYSTPPVYALVLLLCLAGTLYWTLASGPRHYLVGASVAAIEVVGLGLSFFRTAWIAAAVVVFLVLGVRPKRQGRALIAGLGVAGVLGVIYAGVKSSYAVQARLQDTDNLMGRFATYLQGLHIFVRAPLFGVGINRFFFAQQSVVSGDVAGVAPVGDAHNSFIGLLAEQGLVGFLAIAVVCVATWYMIHALRRAAESREDVVFAAAVAAGSLAYLLMSLTFTLLPYGASNAFLALLLGAGAARLDALGSDNGGYFLHPAGEPPPVLPRMTRS